MFQKDTNTNNLTLNTILSCPFSDIYVIFLLANKIMDRKKPLIYIVMPAYNEGKVIKSVLEDLIKHGYQNIIVVDDGSKDDTYEEANKVEDVEIIRLLMNRGQGAALKTGIDYAAENYSPDVIVTFDSDGQHNPEDIKNLIKPILNGDADIVLGSRFLENGKKNNIPTIKKVVLKSGIVFTNLVSKINLTDTHNGIRALSPKAYNSIQITHRDMTHASDIIDEINRNELSYKEVPVHIKYTEYSNHKGQSPFNFAKLGIKVLVYKMLN